MPPDATGVLDSLEAYFKRGNLLADRKDYQMAIADYARAT